MNDFFRFLGFYADAIRDVPRNGNALLFAAIATVFGVIPFELFRDTIPTEPSTHPLTEISPLHPVISVAVLSALAVSTFFTISLILSLWKTRDTIGKTIRDSLRCFPRFMLLKAGFLVAATLSLVILSLPGISASGNSEMLSQGLLFSGYILFIPILTILFFTQAYASFHITLSKTELFSSLRLGYALFAKTIPKSILFGAISIIVIIVTSMLAAVFGMLLSAIVHNGTYAVITFPILSLLLQIFVLLIGKSAWIRFFSFINTPPSLPTDMETSQDHEKVIQKEVPEAG